MFEVFIFSSPLLIVIFVFAIYRIIANCITKMYYGDTNSFCTISAEIWLRRGYDKAKYSCFKMKKKYSVHYVPTARNVTKDDEYDRKVAKELLKIYRMLPTNALYTGVTHEEFVESLQTFAKKKRITLYVRPSHNKAMGNIIYPVMLKRMYKRTFSNWEELTIPKGYYVFWFIKNEHQTIEKE